MRLPFKEFLRPQAIFPIPKGIVPDASAMYGMFGLMANVNAYAEQLSSVATTGQNTVLIPAQLLSGVIQLNAGQTGAFNVTLPGTGAIIAALGPTIPLDGSYSERWTFVNNSGAVANLTAGDGGTAIIGATVIGSSFARTYIAQILGSASISVTNVGQLPL